VRPEIPMVSRWMCDASDLLFLCDSNEAYEKLFCSVAEKAEANLQHEGRLSKKTENIFSRAVLDRRASERHRASFAPVIPTLPAFVAAWR